jgi:hypothetical protein
MHLWIRLFAATLAHVTMRYQRCSRQQDSRWVCFSGLFKLGFHFFVFDKTLDELCEAVVPAAIRFPEPQTFEGLPWEGMGETEALAALAKLAERNNYKIKVSVRCVLFDSGGCDEGDICVGDPVFFSLFRSHSLGKAFTAHTHHQ